MRERNFRQRKKGEQWEQSGTLRTAEQDRSLGFSFLSLKRSGANINTGTSRLER